METKADATDNALRAADQVLTAFRDAEGIGATPKLVTVAQIIDQHFDVSKITAAVNRVLDAKNLTRPLRQQLAEAVGRIDPKEPHAD